MLSKRWNPFPVRSDSDKIRSPYRSDSDKIRSPYAQCAIKFIPRMLSMDLHVKIVHILALAEQTRKFVPRMLSVQ